MTGAERLLLYTTAIQTGLRSGELRCLTRGKLFYDADSPYNTAKAGTTKNRKDARQYIQPELARDLRAHVLRKAPKAPVFAMPDRTVVAEMLRSDLAVARKNWLNEAKNDPDEYSRRDESDFLCDLNHEGELIDFHCLRHTCGAWLALAGVHPKVVQAVMRHGSITLTMDTYGHLFPGQQADAVSHLGEIFALPMPALQATGFNGSVVRSVSLSPKAAISGSWVVCKTNLGHVSGLCLSTQRPRRTGCLSQWMPIRLWHADCNCYEVRVCQSIQGS